MERRRDGTRAAARAGLRTGALSVRRTPATPAAGPGTLHRLVLASAERDPDAPAWGRVRYGELVSRAARLAGTLREAGVGPGDRVVVALDGSVEYLVAYYGTLMAGAAVVPTGPDTRPASLGHTLRHSGAVALVAAGGVLRHLAAVDPPPPALRLVLASGRHDATVPEGLEQADLAMAERDGPELFDAGAGAGALASVSYTSGTTGAPKGVMLSHANLVANVRSIVAYLGLAPMDRVAMVLPYHYVYGTSVLNTHLAVGGSIVDAGSTVFPVRVLETIRDERCTGLSGVPATFSSLLRIGDLGGYDLSSLRYLTQAGGPMTAELTRRVVAAFPGARLYVMYGQTEASARLSWLPPEDLERKAGSVGIPVPGVELSVLDREGRTVPRGVVGEIVARGPNVMMGYLDDPDATVRVLRDGALHTGDMGRMDDEGYLYISGRGSEMICSGGHRIGPQEIENVIATLSGVDACAVVGVADERLGERVVAVVVPENGARPDPRAIQRACLLALPRHKVPSEVRLAAALPHSERGKLLRAEVRAGLERGATVLSAASR